MKATWRVWMYGCTAFVTGLLLFFLIMDRAIWVSSDFNPDYSKIDSCYDAGGVWDKTTRQCSSNKY